MRQSMQVSAFKNDLRSRNAYVERISQLGELIEEDYRLLSGVKSPSLEQTAHGVRNIDLEYERRERISRRMEERNALLESVRRIDRILNEMDPFVKRACIEKYVKGRTFVSVSNDLALSPNAINMRINHEIERVLRK